MRRLEWQPLTASTVEPNRTRSIPTEPDGLFRDVVPLGVDAGGGDRSDTADLRVVVNEPVVVHRGPASDGRRDRRPGRVRCQRVPGDLRPVDVLAGCGVLDRGDLLSGCDALLR